MRKAVFLALVCVGVVFGTWIYFKSKQRLIQEWQSHNLEETLSRTNGYVFVNDVTTVAKAELKEPVVPPGVISESENYRMKELSFGGYELDLSGKTKDLKLEIMDIHSEPLVSKDGRNMRLLISWKTNKLAKSEVEYQKDGSVSKKFSEEGVGFSHALVLSDFDFDSQYTYQISAQDRWGEKTVSDNFAVYAGAKDSSIVENIVKEFQSIFSWLVK